MAKVPHLTLNNDVTIPQLGFGTFQVPPGDTQRVVDDALEAGYRHFDTAAAYANEAGVGAAIAASGIARDEIFITTKLRNGEQGSPTQAFEASREALGLDVIDLYLIHWPVPSKGLYVRAWRAMEEIYSSGAVRAIGVSNFLEDHLDAVMAESTVVPAVNQIELHPTFQQAALVSKCRSHGIAVEAYSPLGQGADLSGNVLSMLADSHGSTPAQVVVAWHLAVGNIVIPKSADPLRMRENLAATEISLGPNEVVAVTALESGFRTGDDPALAAFTQF
jgi:2,5-diketo-D-gluconate reductase A